MVGLEYDRMTSGDTCSETSLLYCLRDRAYKSSFRSMGGKDNLLIASCDQKGLMGFKIELILLKYLITEKQLGIKNPPKPKNKQTTQAVLKIKGGTEANQSLISAR